MGIREKIRDQTSGQLRPGEQVQAVFGAQTHSVWWIFAGLIVFVIINRYRCVVVTDQRILVFNSGRFLTAAPKEVVHELPRATRIGPAGGLWHTIWLGEELRVHKRYHQGIAAADAAVPASPPPAPAN